MPDKMKKNLLILIWWAFPAVVLISVILHRSSKYSERTSAEWVEELRLDQDMALKALQKSGSNALPALEEGLKSKAPTERCRAASALGKMGPVSKAAIPNLISALDDRSMAVQNEAMMSLARIGITNGGLTSKLMMKLTNATTEVFAATLLNSIEQERQLEKLPRLAESGYDYGMVCLKSATPSMRLNGAIQLASVAQDNKQAMGALNSLLSDTNGWVRYEVSLLITNPLALSNFTLVSE